jgi:hypothetical protein
MRNWNLGKNDPLAVSTYICVDSHLVVHRNNKKYGTTFEVADGFVLRILYMSFFYTFQNQFSCNDCLKEMK